MNGSGWWEESERRFRSSLHIEKPRSYRFLQMQFAAMDPYQHMDRLSGRSLLSLRGGATMLSMEPLRNFILKSWPHTVM